MQFIDQAKEPGPGTCGKPDSPRFLTRTHVKLLNSIKICKIILSGFYRSFHNFQSN